MEFNQAKEKAIKYIVVAKKTEFEVRKKLKQYGFKEDIIDEVISYLISINYLNDKDYVECYLRQCDNFLKYSIYEIKQKLLQKGIKKYIIDNEIQNIDVLDYENKVVCKILNGKCKNMEPIKQKQYLYRRGFVKIDTEY